MQEPFKQEAFKQKRFLLPTAPGKME